ncbi:uncharacterized protein BDR25DRAFT_303324 [Lindgomyces ingoldianus]|uniref:Uncharacterized protein n=1 Tax=Lindgomyces ingoldianus TaxID=673940 RepID=A0ACB6QYI1_9PLEO|nr:uncharacterized protein BDR25DRAFT_303324 [Lindgomyces ingoldianus]KAF2471261.1 hypothetical protein BDR25DRAFT_303324 [Lindgomyces ingoldianus]
MSYSREDTKSSILIPFPDPQGFHLPDSGEVFNALTTTSTLQVMKVRAPDRPVRSFILRPMHLLPDNECLKGNTTSTPNVVEAACKLGVKTIIVSSETTYEVCLRQGDLDVAPFPWMKTTTSPPWTRTPFRSCVAGELLEDLQEGLPQSTSTYINDPLCQKCNAWSYIDARDLGLH